MRVTAAPIAELCVLVTQCPCSGPRMRVLQ